MAHYNNHRQEPYFSFLKEGTKTVEGRLRKGKYAKIKTGDSIKVQNQSGTEEVGVIVVAVRYYLSFLDMLTAEDFAKVLPDATSPQEGVDIYRRFYSAEDELRYGVVAIEVRLDT